MSSEKVRGKPKLSSNPVDIAIRQKQKAINKLYDRKANVMALAKEDCDKIDKLVERQKVLLEALKNGRLKP